MFNFWRDFMSFSKSWGIQNGDFSLSSSVTNDHYKCFSKSEDLSRPQAHSMFREAEIFRLSTTEITFKDGRIITQKTISEELNRDLNKR